MHYRHLKLFFYQKGNNAKQAANEVFTVYGKGAVAERTVRKWFSRFKAGDFNLEDQVDAPPLTKIRSKHSIKNNPTYNRNVKNIKIHHSREFM